MNFDKLFFIIVLLCLCQALSQQKKVQWRGPVFSFDQNQTSSGFVKIYYNSNITAVNNVLELRSDYMQDASGQRSYFSMGDDNQDSICVAKYWFLQNSTYTLKYPSLDCNSTPVCSCSSFNYSQFYALYNPNYFVSLDTVFSQKYNKTINQYYGKVVDEFGDKSAYILNFDADTKAYLGLYNLQIQELTGIKEDEYLYQEIYFKNVSTTQPNSSYFDLPEACQNITCTDLEDQKHSDKKKEDGEKKHHKDHSNKGQKYFNYTKYQNQDQNNQSNQNQNYSKWADTNWTKNWQDQWKKEESKWGNFVTSLKNKIQKLTNSTNSSADSNTTLKTFL